jgi:hypothetical protein
LKAKAATETPTTHTWPLLRRRSPRADRGGDVHLGSSADTGSGKAGSGAGRPPAAHEASRGTEKPTSGTAVPTRRAVDCRPSGAQGEPRPRGKSWRETVARYPSCPFRRVGSCTRLYAGAPGLGPVVCLASFQDLLAVRARLAGPKSVINNGTNRIREFLTGVTVLASTFCGKFLERPASCTPAR